MKQIILSPDYTTFYWYREQINKVLALINCMMVLKWCMYISEENNFAKTPLHSSTQGILVCLFWFFYLLRQ